jgi:hypothetical protein
VFDIDFKLGGCDNRNGTLLPMIVFGLGLGSGGHAARFKGRNSLFDCASADTTNLFEIAAILVECSFEMCTTGCFGVVVPRFVLVVARIFIAGLLALEGSNGDNAFF